MSKDLTVNNDLNSSAQPVLDQDGNSSALYLSSNSVGVGTESTDYPLAVQSSGPGAAAIQVIGSSGNALITSYEGTSGHGNFYVRDSYGTAMVKLAAGTNASYFNNGKNFGIGTDSPSAMLDVNGSAQVKTLVILNMAPASEAPSSDSLETVLIDPATGNLYYQ